MYVNLIFIFVPHFCLVFFFEFFILNVYHKLFKSQIAKGLISIYVTETLLLCKISGTYFPLILSTSFLWSLSEAEMPKPMLIFSRMFSGYLALFHFIFWKIFSKYKFPSHMLKWLLFIKRSDGWENSGWKPFKMLDLIVSFHMQWWVKAWLID